MVANEEKIDTHAMFFCTSSLQPAKKTKKQGTKNPLFATSMYNGHRAASGVLLIVHTALTVAVGATDSDSALARAYWNKVHPPLAHIDYQNPLHGSEERLVRRWNRAWLGEWSKGGPPFNVVLKDRRIGDYGIGAGLLGKVLCQHEIGGYIGFDVAERSLSAARTMLSESAPSKWNKLRKLAPKVGRIALTVRDLHNSTMEKTYAPEGTGFKRARDNFQTLRSAPGWR